MGIYHVFYVCNSKKTHLLDRLSAVLSRRHLVVRIQDLIDLQYGDLPARPLLALERDHLVSPLESRVRTKIPAARAARFRCRFHGSWDRLGRDLFLCLIQRSSADDPRQPAVCDLDGLAARQAALVFSIKKDAAHLSSILKSLV